MNKPICAKCRYHSTFKWGRRKIGHECKHPRADDQSAYAFSLIGRPTEIDSAFADNPTVKASPKWCPLRTEDGGTEDGI